MYHKRKLNYKLNRFQGRTLGIVYNDKCATFYQLLEKEKFSDNSSCKESLIFSDRNI